MSMMKRQPGNKAGKSHSLTVNAKKNPEKQSSGGNSSQGDINEAQQLLGKSGSNVAEESNNIRDDEPQRHSINDWRRERLLDRIKKFD